MSRADAVANHEAAARGRRLHPAAAVLAATWPGLRESSAPPDFPGRSHGGKIVFSRLPDPVLAAEPEVGEALLRAVESEPEAENETPARTVVLPNKRRTTRDERQREAQAKAKAQEVTKRPSPIRPPRRLNDIVAAVYAALADPLAADTAEAREERAAKVREIGLLAASTALVAVLIYGIFPVRTFIDQRTSTADAEERLDKLSETNERLEREADRLRDDAEIEYRARKDYGWVYPGEELYGVTPPPAAPTTTTTTQPD